MAPALLASLLAACSPDAIEFAPPAVTEEADPSASLFLRDEVLEVSITLDPDDWDALRLAERDLVDMLTGDCLAEPFEDPYEWVEADVTVDGETFTDVGLRKKGLLGSASTTKPSLKVRFDRFEDDVSFRGLTRLTFNNLQQDPTQMRTCLAYDAFASAGLIAPRCSFAHLTVNGEDLGAYAHVDSVDEEFLARNYTSPEGRLWEGTLSDFRDGWTGSFDPKTHEDDVDHAGLLALSDALLVEGDEALFAALDPILDVDQFLHFWATEVLVGHWDGYAGNTNNFFVYEDPSDGRIRFMPWGADATFDSRTPFGADASPAAVAIGALSVRLAESREGRSRYEAALADVLGTWDPDVALAEIDRMEALLDPWSDRGDRAYVNDLRDIVAAKADDLWAELDSVIEWNEQLRPNPCMVDSGSVDGTFTSAWGSYGTADPFTAGEATLTIVWGEDVLPLDTVGVVAGETDGQGIVVFVGTMGDDAWLAPYVVFDLEAATPGQIAVTGTNAVLLYADASTDWQWVQAAWLGEGTLTLTQAGTDDGDVFSGTLTATVMASGA